jgi:epoxyqueuosine reductase
MADALGFAAIGVADTDLARAEAAFEAWLAAGHHGAMDYMARHGRKRSRPAELVPGTVRVITARMPYLAPDARSATEVLADAEAAYIARYALGRDYHKLFRQRLQRLAERMTEVFGPFGSRVFTDSAPVLEVALAEKSGLGWTGKHSLLLTREAGSYFFLGEIYTDLPLPLTAPMSAHCGTCRACLQACPTGAIVAEAVVDARRCISYLTIELAGSIPEELRPLLGNRIYGCDDCQIFCPWNRGAPGMGPPGRAKGAARAADGGGKTISAASSGPADASPQGAPAAARRSPRASSEPDFAVRHGLDHASLVELFAWSEAEFKRHLTGSAIHRIGYERWLRNIAVALGNATPSPRVCQALMNRRDDPSPLVREHVAWALQRLGRA